MPRVTFQETTFECAPGANLRAELFRAGLTPHNGQATWFNCKGLGTCGTCAVQVEGKVSPPSLREQARLSFPPHTLVHGLRLACQVEVLGDLTVTKHEGFWGQHIARGAAPGEAPEETVG